MACILSEAPLVKMICFSFSSIYQLEITPELVMWVLPNFLLICGTASDPDLSMSCVCCHSLFSFTCMLVVISWKVILVTSNSIPLLESFHFLSCKIPRGLKGMIRWRNSPSDWLFPGLLLCILSSCGSLHTVQLLYLFPSTAGSTFLDDSWARHW